MKGRPAHLCTATAEQLIGLVLERLRFPCRIVHQRRDFDHVTVRYLRLCDCLGLPQPRSSKASAAATRVA
jgi:hypothetical protein